MRCALSPLLSLSGSPVASSRASWWTTCASPSRGPRSVRQHTQKKKADEWKCSFLVLVLGPRREDLDSAFALLHCCATAGALLQRSGGTVPHACCAALWTQCMWPQSAPLALVTQRPVGFRQVPRAPGSLSAARCVPLLPPALPQTCVVSRQGFIFRISDCTRTA